MSVENVRQRYDNLETRIKNLFGNCSSLWVSYQRKHGELTEVYNFLKQITENIQGLSLSLKEGQNCEGLVNDILGKLSMVIEAREIADRNEQIALKNLQNEQDVLMKRFENIKRKVTSQKTDREQKVAPVVPVIPVAPVAPVAPTQPLVGPFGELLPGAEKQLQAQHNQMFEQARQHQLKEARRQQKLQEQVEKQYRDAQKTLDLKERTRRTKKEKKLREHKKTTTEYLQRKRTELDNIRAQIKTYDTFKRQLEDERKRTTDQYKRSKLEEQIKSLRNTQRSLEVKKSDIKKILKTPGIIKSNKSGQDLLDRLRRERREQRRKKRESQKKVRFLHDRPVSVGGGSNRIISRHAKSHNKSRIRSRIKLSRKLK